MQILIKNIFSKTSFSRYLSSMLLFSALLFTMNSCGLLVRGAVMMLQGGAISKVNGNVQMRFPGGKTISLSKDNRLSASGLFFPGYELITGKNSSVDFQLTRYIHFRIGPQSSLTLNLANILEREDFLNIGMKLNRGEMLGDVAKSLSGNSKLLIQAGTLLSRVRGTQFRIINKNGQQSVSVKQGKVESSRSGRTVLVESGEILNNSTELKKKTMSDTEAVALHAVANIEKLSKEDRDKIRALAETHTKNQALIKQTMLVYKKAIGKVVEKQKEVNTKKVNKQKDTDQKNIRSIQENLQDKMKKIQSGTTK